ncbi:dynamin family protein [Cereibacter ovatus]|uniref:Dynamin family protein n=1 Tax=Cereibacter ovatus TaxID=439529 RepID=A0A285CX73_9RHOB|nr:dynamin family protein [Cereibacter ovatus]SNX71553.1 dynamin family protein [Cereibacter ovatus]
MSFQSAVPRLDEPVLRRAGGRRLRVVVAGEFKSGKSSVINALLRQPVLPMQSRQASRPAFLVRHASEGAGTVLLHDGSGRSLPADALDEITDFGGAGLCEVMVSAPHLDGVELVELPFPCGGEVGAEAIALMAAADLLIWVSIASQAWRLSEKAILSQLPPMRSRSVIVLSRADKLRTAGDWDRVEDRVQREAGPFFSAVAFVQATRETIRQAAGDDRAWETSGGRILAELIVDRRRQFVPEPILRPTLAPTPPAGPRGAVAPAPVSAAPPAQPALVLQTPVVQAPKVQPPPHSDGMEEVAVSLGGFLCGGIASLATGDCLAAFGPGRADALRLAPALRSLLAGQAALEAAAGHPVDETAIRLGPNLLLAVPLGGAGVVAFLLLRQDGSNLVLARTALRRIGGLWTRRD